MSFEEKFITLVLLIPVIGALLFQAINPRESFLWGKRWQFKNENLEPSDSVIKNGRTMAIIGLIIVVIFIVRWW